MIDQKTFDSILKIQINKLVWFEHKRKKKPTTIQWKFNKQKKRNRLGNMKKKKKIRMVLSSHNKTHPLTTIIKIPVEKSKKPKERKRKQIGNKQTVLLQIKKNGAFT